MRLLRQAIRCVWIIMEQTRSEMRDDSAFQYLTDLEEKLISELEKIQAEGREHLEIHGVKLPFHHPLALEIMGCLHCHCAINAQIGIDEQPGEYEDAGLDTCPEHARKVSQYTQDEIVLQGMTAHGERLGRDLVNHMQGIELDQEEF